MRFRSIVSKSRKCLQNRHFSTGSEVYQTEVSAALRLRGSRRPPRLTASRSSRSSIGAARAAARSSSAASGTSGGAGAASLAAGGSGTRPTANRMRGRCVVTQRGRELRHDLLLQERELVAPRSRRSSRRASTPSREMRCGHAARETAGADRVSARRCVTAASWPASGTPAAAERVAEIVADPLHQPVLTSPGETTSSCAGASGQRLRAGRRHDRLPTPPEPVAQDPPAVGVELGERVVEQEKRRDADVAGSAPPPRRAGARGPSGVAHPESRTPGGLGRRTRDGSRRDGARARSSRARGRGRGGPGAARRSAGRRHIPARHRGAPARPHTPPERGREHLDRLRSRLDELGRGLGEGLRPGLEHARGERPAATRRRPALR